MKWLLDLPLRAPRATLAVMLAITAVLGFWARTIRVDSSIEELLPLHDPDRAYYEETVATFGNEEVIVIGVFADDVFAPATLRKIDTLSTRLAEIDGVHEVLSLTTVKGVEVGDFGLTTGRLMRRLPATAEEVEAFRAKVLANPLYLKNVVSADGRAAGVSVVFEPLSDEEFLRRGIEDQVRALVAQIGGPETTAITGIPTIKVHGARLMERDTATFTPLAMLLIVIVLVWAFRTVRGVLIPLATVIVGVVWTTGVMVLAGSAINMGTLVLNPLLMVIGIASGIHIVSQYYLELRPGRSALEVVHAAMEHMRVPVTIAAVTTLIGFATLALTPIRAIREFGLYSVLGIVVILLASFTVAPALLALLPLPKRVRQDDGENGWIGRLLDRLGTNAVLNPKTVLFTCVGLVVAIAWGIRYIDVETDYIGFFHPTSPIRIDNQLIASRLAGTQPIYVVLDGAEPQAVTRLEALAALRAIQDFIDAQPGVDKTISALDYLGLLRRTLQPDAGDALPTNQGEVDQILALINPADIRAVLSRDQRRANIIVRTTLSRSGDVNAFVERVQAFANDRLPPGITARATGTVVLLNRSADALAWGQITGLWQELTVLLVLLSFLFLSVRIGILALIPNVVPTIVLFGLMGWTGIPLNISTSMIAAIAIGIAIDDTIHFLTTFSAELRKTGSQEQAVLNAMGSAGRAAVYVAVALAAGFLVVCLSSFQPVQYFGALASATMAVSLVTELFLSPALVTITKIITVWDLLFLRLGPEPHREIPLFAGLRPFQAKIVVLMGHLECGDPGTAIARHGEMSAEMYVLLNGRAEARRGTIVLRSLGRGDIVGEMGMVRRRPRTADVIVQERAEYLVLDVDFLRRLRRRYPRIAATVFLNLSHILSDRLETTTEQLAEIAHADTPASAAGRDG
jgi:predicted RND superfamily exporter protein/CRP-like cAMP-binding protein